MYKPAVTIVAACIKAETGVGPSMASGSHTKSGIWADFPVAPRKSSKVIAVTNVPPSVRRVEASALTVANSMEPNDRKINITADNTPKSPTRLKRKAFLAASAAESFSK